jgi:hypothetical protein
VSFTAFLSDGSSAVLDFEMGGAIDSFEFVDGGIFVKARDGGWVAAEAIISFQPYIESPASEPKSWFGR